MGLAQRDQVSAQPNITHGQLATFHGIEYKWQQVSASGWVGILPEEWDDNIHVQNTKVLEIHPDIARDMDLFLRRQQ